MGHTSLFKWSSGPRPQGGDNCQRTSGQPSYMNFTGKKKDPIREDKVLIPSYRVNPVGEGIIYANNELRY